MGQQAGPHQPLDELLGDKTPPMRNDIDAVVRALHLEQAILCGWSYGALVIFDYLRHYGEEAVGGIHLVDAIKSFIEAGKLRTYSINSVNRYSLLNEHMPAPLKAELLTRYDRYIVDEVIPLIRKDCSDGENRPLTTGASLGAFLSVNAYFKHPDLVRGVIAMSCSYDVRSYLKGHYDDNVYFNNPAMYAPFAALPYLPAAALWVALTAAMLMASTAFAKSSAR